jgi:UDP-glucose 4-epimerase
VAGFIGSTLADRLAATGADIVGLDCFADYYPRAVKERNLSGLSKLPSFRLIESRIQDADLVGLLRDRTHVFHLAAQAGVRKSWGRDFQIYTTNNIEATQVLLEACASSTLERVVYASSSSVYGDAVALPMREDALPQPVSPYGVSKLAAEQLCHLYQINYGVPAVSLRYFTVYGPRQRPDMAFHKFLRATILGEPINLYGDGEQTRDFTFVTDAVSATIAAATRGIPGRVYNIGGGSRVSIHEVLEMIGRVAKRRPQLSVDPAQKGDMRHTYADTTLARTDLGFVPTVALEEGLTAEYAWLAGVL